MLGSATSWGLDVGTASSSNRLSCWNRSFPAHQGGTTSRGQEFVNRMGFLMCSTCSQPQAMGRAQDMGAFFSTLESMQGDRYIAKVFENF